VVVDGFGTRAAPYGPWTTFVTVLVGTGNGAEAGTGALTTFVTVAAGAGTT